MHLDLDLAAGAGDGFKQRLPKIIGALRHAAFAMHAQGDAGNLGTFLQQYRQRITAVSRAAFPVGFAIRAIQTMDHMIGMWAVGPLPGMGPDAELKFQPARTSLSGDEFQGL